MIAALQRLMQNKELVDTAPPAAGDHEDPGAKGFTALISTHPPLEERIAALQNAR